MRLHIYYLLEDKSLNKNKGSNHFRKTKCDHNIKI